MGQYVRTPEMEYNMTIDAICGNVELDLPVEVRSHGGKLKVYSPKLGAFLQFPKDLRRPRARFTVDAVMCQRGTDSTFYRAYKGSIRDEKGNVVG